jgi:DNA-binding MarR family transcriptional regulator
MARKNPKRGKEPFLYLPDSLIFDPAFGSLSGNAVKLFIEIAKEYNGRNNGDLAATFNMLKKRGFKSKGTLFKSLQELEAKGFIEQTRQGGKNRCSLYAVTFHNIDECAGKLDINATKRPSVLWKKINSSALIETQLKLTTLQENQ